MKSLHKIFIIGIVIILFSMAIGAVLNNGYKNFYAPFYQKLNEIFDGNTNYNVLLLGNSKVQFGMNPYVIDSVGKVNSYNIGFAASSFTTMHLLLSAYLHKHAPPKQMVWCVQESMFFTNADASTTLLFYNYVKHASVQEYMDTMNIPYYLPLYLPFTKYLYFDDYNRINVINGYRKKSPFVGLDVYNYKGFTIHKKSKSVIQFNPLPKFDSDTIHYQSLFYFNKIINLCKQNKIKIIFVWPPNMNDKTNQKNIIGNEKLILWMDSVCNVNKYNLIRFDNTNEFLPTEFIDDSHLNYNGSTHYSAIIGKLLDSLYRY